MNNVKPISDKFHEKLCDLPYPVSIYEIIEKDPTIVCWSETDFHLGILFEDGSMWLTVTKPCPDVRDLQSDSLACGFLLGEKSKNKTSLRKEGN